MIGLLDTSVVIAANKPGESPPDLSDFDEVLISSLTFAELEFGLRPGRGAPISSGRRQRLDEIRDRFGPGLPFDAPCLAALRRLLAHIAANGGDPRVDRFDRMIAATALAHAATLVTRDQSDSPLFTPLIPTTLR
ncbi:MAG: PIN domain-containing protein [Bifidobacteriaceae bacterium]|jgi:predicted nucleic acid-binding protein|nr:PIN domain-containing protein [Bifidobacteriaceae bacterium]